MSTDLPFRYYLRVRYAECDAQKVVFNARYGFYVDVAVVEFLRALGLQDQLLHGAYDFQLVKQTTEWKRPARYDEVLEVSVYTSTLGTTSFTLICEFRRAGEPALLVRIETIYVLMLAQGLVKTPLPEAIRAQLAKGAVAVYVNHAGDGLHQGLPVFVQP